jgi:hypothetical protein
MNSSELDHQLTNLTKIAVSLAIYGWSKVQKAHILYIYLNHESYLTAQDLFTAQA